MTTKTRIEIFNELNYIYEQVSYADECFDYSTIWQIYCDNNELDVDDEDCYDAQIMDEWINFIENL